MTYLARINGRRVVAGKVLRTPWGRIRCHAVRRFGRLAWTADKWGNTWANTASEAIIRTTPGDRDTVTKES